MSQAGTEQDEFEYTNTPATRIHEEFDDVWLRNEWDPDPDLPQGFADMEMSDLEPLLYGNDEITGHENYDRGKDLEKIAANPLKAVKQPGNFLPNLWRNYVEMMEDRKVIMYDEKEGEYTAIPPTFRGNPHYRAEKGDKFDALEKYIKRNNLWSMFLTFSPQVEDDETAVSSHTDMREARPAVQDFLKKHLGYNPERVAVIENTKRGHSHLHILLVGVRYIPQINRVLEWWEEHGYGKKNGVDYSDPIPPRDAGRSVGYLIKYLNKEAASDAWLGLMYLTRTRTFSFSGGLNDSLAAVGLFREDQFREDGGGEWTMVGIFGPVWEEIKETYDRIPPPEYLAIDYKDDFDVNWLGPHPAGSGMGSSVSR